MDGFAFPICNRCGEARATTHDLEPCPDMWLKKAQHSREDTTIEVLQELNPPFGLEGTVTAGNESGINEGASAILAVINEESGSDQSRSFGSVVGNDCT